MGAPNNAGRGPNFFGGFILLAGLYWAAISSGGLTLNPGFQPISTFFTLMFGIVVLGAISAVLRRMAGLADFIVARTPTGLHGTADWADKKAIKTQLTSRRKGLLWGFLQGTKQQLWLGFESNAMCVAPAGSGKSLFFLIAAILGVRGSRLILDFKGELYVMLANTLRRMGVLVYVLNPSRVHGREGDQFDTFNPLDIFVDFLYTPGGLRELPEDLREFSFEIYPEPKGGKDENRFFEDGSREFIQLSTVTSILLKEYEASLYHASTLLKNACDFKLYLRWMAGADEDGQHKPELAMDITQAEWAKHHTDEDIEGFKQWLQGLAESALKLNDEHDGRTFDSFITGSQQNSAVFGFGRLAPAMSHSTFSMNCLKGRRPAAVFVVGDASRPETYKKYLGLIQWCAQCAVKRHPNKKRVVYFFYDEATNYLIHGLGSLLTWGRAYGVRLVLVFQALSAFKAKYGQDVLDTLFSETEIKYFLPGQREQNTLELISKALGDKSVVVASHSQPSLDQGLQSTLSEQRQALMTTNQIRESKHGLLFVRNAKPIKVTPISYARVFPWCWSVGLNPFHNRRLWRRIKVWLWF